MVYFASIEKSNSFYCMVTERPDKCCSWQVDSEKVEYDCVLYWDWYAHYIALFVWDAAVTDNSWPSAVLYIRFDVITRLKIEINTWRASNIKK
jgi:hypothetical protein